MCFAGCSAMVRSSPSAAEPFSNPQTVLTRAEETDSKGNGKARYLYRAVDSTGPTIAFLLTAQRDQAAAKRFFRRAWRDAGNVTPRVINVIKTVPVRPPSGSCKQKVWCRGAAPGARASSYTMSSHKTIER